MQPPFYSNFTVLESDFQVLRKLLKSCICSLMVLSLLTSLIVPAFAVSSEVVASLVGTDIFSWLLDQGVDIVAGIGSFFDKSICAANPNTDKLHDFEKRHTMVGDKTGYFYVCRYCGKFAGEVLEPAYDEYVQELPATGYDSSGGLFWSPTPAYMYLSSRFGLDFLGGLLGCEHYPYPEKLTTTSNAVWSFDCSSNSVRLQPAFEEYGLNNLGLRAWFCYEGVAPIQGWYSRLSTPTVSGYWIDSKEPLNKATN